jgi:hypothetical protein
MKKIVRLTESDLARIVNRIIGDKISNKSKADQKSAKGLTIF